MKYGIILLSIVLLLLNFNSTQAQSNDCPACGRLNYAMFIQGNITDYAGNTLNNVTLTISYYDPYRQMIIIDNRQISGQFSLTNPSIIGVGDFAHTPTNPKPIITVSLTIEKEQYYKTNFSFNVTPSLPDNNGNMPSGTHSLGTIKLIPFHTSIPIIEMASLPNWINTNAVTFQFTPKNDYESELKCKLITTNYNPYSIYINEIAAKANQTATLQLTLPDGTTGWIILCSDSTHTGLRTGVLHIDTTQPKISDDYNNEIKKPGQTIKLTAQDSMDSSPVIKYCVSTTGYCAPSLIGVEIVLNERGQNYLNYSATDKANNTANKGKIIKVNNLPVINPIQITPQTAYVNTDLTCDADISDNDNQQMTVQYSWKKNGNNISNTKTLVNGSFQKDDVLTCEISVNDSLETITSSSSLIIQNSAPTATLLSVTPDTPYTNNDLICGYNYNDVDSDSEINTIITWFKDGIIQSNLENLTIISSGNTTKGESWICQVTPSDGITLGTSVNASAVIIQNSAPTINMINLTRQEDEQATVINLTNYSSDIDNDSLTYTVNYDNHNLTLTINNALLEILQPVQDWNGIINGCVTVNDSETTSNSCFNVTTQPVNDPPVLQPIGYNEFQVYSPFTLQLMATDVDSQILTYQSNNTIFQPSVTGLINAMINETSSYSVQFTVNDGEYIANETGEINIVNDTTPPTIISSMQSSNELLRGEQLDITLNWEDNSPYSNATLYINNKLFQSKISRSNAIFNVNTANFQTGMIIWYAMITDLVGNSNQTQIKSLALYAKATLANITLSNDTLLLEDMVNIRCRVIEEDTLLPINNYPIQVYHNTLLIGTNNTNQSGWADYSYKTNSSGLGNIICRITNQTGNYYYSANNAISRSLFIKREVISPQLEIRTDNELWINNQNATLTFKAVDNYDNTLPCIIKKDNSTLFQGNITTERTIGLGELNMGELTFFMECNDSSRNNANITRRYSIDREGPKINEFMPENETMEEFIELKVGDDASGININKFELFIDNKKIDAYYKDNTTLRAYPELTYGRHTIRVILYDKTGKTTTKSWNFKYTAMKENITIIETPPEDNTTYNIKGILEKINLIKEAIALGSLNMEQDALIPTSSNIKLIAEIPNITKKVEEKSSETINTNDFIKELGITPREEFNKYSNTKINLEVTNYNFDSGYDNSTRILITVHETLPRNTNFYFHLPAKIDSSKIKTFPSATKLIPSNSTIILWRTGQETSVQQFEIIVNEDIKADAIAQQPIAILEPLKIKNAASRPAIVLEQERSRINWVIFIPVVYLILSIILLSKKLNKPLTKKQIIKYSLFNIPLLLLLQKMRIIFKSPHINAEEYYFLRSEGRNVAIKYYNSLPERIKTALDYLQSAKKPVYINDFVKTYNLTKYDFKNYFLTVFAEYHWISIDGNTISFL